MSQDKAAAEPKQPPPERRKVMVELRANPALIAAVGRGSGGASYVRKEPFDVTKLLPGMDIDVDPSYPPTRVPAAIDDRKPDYDPAADQPSDDPTRRPPKPAFNYLIRAEVNETQLRKLRGHPDVIGVFSDPEIHPFITCGYNSARGTHLDVERLLCVPKMKFSRPGRLRRFPRHRRYRHQSRTLECPWQKSQSRPSPGLVAHDCRHSRPMARLSRNDVRVRRLHRRAQVYPPRHRCSSFRA